MDTHFVPRPHEKHCDLMGTRVILELLDAGIVLWAPVGVVLAGTKFEELPSPDLLVHFEAA
jgi:hypothetical protein